MLNNHVNEVAANRAKELVDFEERAEEIRRLANDLAEDLEDAHVDTFFDYARSREFDEDLQRAVDDPDNPFDRWPDRAIEAVREDGEPAPPTGAVPTKGSAFPHRGTSTPTDYAVEPPDWADVDDE